MHHAVVINTFFYLHGNYCALVVHAYMHMMFNEFMADWYMFHNGKWKKMGGGGANDFEALHHVLSYSTL